jgi:hypothetical protein
MRSTKLAFVYTLTPMEHKYWAKNPKSRDGISWRAYIERLIRQKARMKKKSRFMILSPDGLVLSEDDC